MYIKQTFSTFTQCGNIDRAMVYIISMLFIRTVNVVVVFDRIYAAKNLRME